MRKDELTNSEAFALQFDAQSKLLRTNMPAQVVAVNLARNSVDVQPVLKGVRSNDEEYLLPVINDVQIQYYGAGNFWVTFEPKAGDYCVLSVSDRSIEAWKKSGGIIDPKLNRHHNMTDAFAYFGINPFPDAIPAIQADTMHLRTKDGTTGIKIKADSIKYDVAGVEVADMSAALITFNVPVTMAATLNVDAETTTNGITDAGTNIGSTHAHSGVTSGDSNTGTPV
tara:strand:- start:19 stop:696 length:678 start_codon:yes stop_codon:yes gene_type:complete